MATPTNSGYRTQIKNLTVNSTSWTTFDLTEIPNNLCLRLREAGDLKVALNDAIGPLQPEYFTIPSGTALTYDWNAGKKTNIIYLKASIASGTAEIIATYEG
jgi:hypothetical protein